MRNIHIIGNWKMNQTLKDIELFFTEFKKATSHTKLQCVYGIAPQALHLGTLQEQNKSKGLSFIIGGQNCHDQDKGAFTGEISPQSLKDFNADFTLIAHSERRAIFNEGHDLIARKVQLALDHNLPVIYCVGETLEERESGKTRDILKEQITAELQKVAPQLQDQIIIAYEPVWAIGTGKTATPSEANQAHADIREILTEDLGWQGKKTIILYGGSVKPENCEELLSCPEIDGALVGGASLKGDSFAKLCLSAQKFY